MNEKIIKNVTNWTRYVAAIATWFADSLATFPSKKKYFESSERIDKKQAA